jgi:predicted NBD/HSP70 family sugar kinase
LAGPITRTEIAKRVGLTVQTVSNISRELEEQGFITGNRKAPKTRGFPPTALTLNPEGGHAIGIHLTPLGLEAALINLSGEVIAREGRPGLRMDPDTVFDTIAELAKNLKKSTPSIRLLGAGLAMPGPFDVESMSFVGPTTLEGWAGVAIAQCLEKATHLPAFIEVDHAASALGERLYGEGRAFRDFYYLYVGVGLGGCLVQDGLPVRGAFRNAGEIGHVPVVPGGEPCPCGNHGCLERYVSLEAFERRSKVIGTDRWIAEAAPRLRQAVTMIENLFDPETIIIGGLPDGVLLDSLLVAAQPLGNSISQRKDRTAPRVIRSGAGQAAVLRGAAALAVSGVLSPRFGILFARDEAQQDRDPMLTAGRAA